MSDPFLIEGPAVISFSGGRTSGYMLWRILLAHGGKLPEDVRAIFANTGKEHPATLDFVHECSERWGVPITWVEYLRGVVTYDTASSNGEPYEELILAKKFLPNPVMRFCTSFLKVKPIEDYCKSIGWESWVTVMGIRADEPRRVSKARAQGDKVLPLADARITRDDVLQFWADYSFDLEIETHGGITPLGNCDLCFLKGADSILSIIRKEPELAHWWMRMERMVSAKFRNDRPSYAEMYKYSTQQTELFKFGDEPLQDCMCVD